MIIDVDALAQEIRRIDGNHSLGAAALAEALMPFLQEQMADRKPLTDEQMAKVREEWARKNRYDPAHGSFRAGFRAAERAHGIKQENE